MKLPAGTRVIDATGKWVTPGIVAGFSRLGLAEVDLTSSKEDGGGREDTSGAADDTSSTGPFNAAIDVVPAINPLDSTIAVNRADGVTRAIVAPGTGKNIFAGPGRGDRHRRRPGADDGGAEIPVRRAWRSRRGRRRAGRAQRLSPCSATPFAKPRSSGATRSALQAARSEAPDEREQPVVRDPNESRLYGWPAQPGRAADPL